MIKNLKISQILVYYDFPEIFIAVDDVDTNYICLLVDVEVEEVKYISTPVSRKRLSEFINGKIDLREIFENPEIKEWFFFNKISEGIVAKLWEELTLPADYLPDSGFLYQKHLLNDELILSEVLEKKNTVVHLAISDSTDSNSIDANHLGDVVRLYQSIIENSFKKALTQKKILDKNSFLVPENYKLRAFASSHSSFNVHFYSISQSDLFGNTIIELGLEIFDVITKDFEDSEEYINSLRNFKGHTINSLKRLVKKLIDCDIKIKHKWLAPNQEETHLSVIDKQKAEKIFSILTQSEELAVETRIFTGYFVQVDVKKGTWRIYNTEDEKEYNGETLGQLLQGVTVETVNYKLTCQEIIEELKVTEKEKTKYILQSISNIE